MSPNDLKDLEEMREEINVWSKDEFDQLGNYEHFEDQLLTPKFFADLAKVETISLFHSHICFSIPKVIKYYKLIDSYCFRKDIWFCAL